jgi:hypothetical protein
MQWLGQVTSSSSRVVRSSCGNLRGYVRSAALWLCFNSNPARRRSPQLFIWIIALFLYTCCELLFFNESCPLSRHWNTLHLTDTYVVTICYFRFHPVWWIFTEWPHNIVLTYILFDQIYWKKKLPLVYPGFPISPKFQWKVKAAID